MKVLHYWDWVYVVQVTVATLEELYWLEEILRLVVEEVASRLVETSIVASVEVGANLVEVASNLG